jgi:hypothetical protein
MPVHLNHHILVDSNGKATVVNMTISGGVVPITQLQPGDTVTFSSNDPNSEIRYKEQQGAPPPKTQKGSPFGSDLPPGRRHKVSLGTPFTVKTACDVDNHFTFECGHDVGGNFSEWGARTGRPVGGNTPGPED